MRESWEAQWKSWIVTTDTVEDQRCPGKLKSNIEFVALELRDFSVEFSLNKGEFIALSPKCYFAFNESDSSVKLGTKGVPSKCQLTLEQFRSKLYHGSESFVDFDSLRMIKNKMTRLTTTKVALNDCFIKFHVENDGITCSPLTDGNKYI